MIGELNFLSFFNSVPSDIGAKIVSQTNASVDELKRMGQICHALNRWVWKELGNQGRSRSMEWQAGPQGLQRAIMQSQGLAAIQLTSSRHFAACLQEIRLSSRFEAIEHLVLAGKAQELLDAKTQNLLRQFTHLKSLTLKNVSFPPQVVATLPKISSLHLVDCQVRATSQELFSAIACQSELRTLEVQGCITRLAERIRYSKEGILDLAALGRLERLYGPIGDEKESKASIYEFLDDLPSVRKVTTLPFGKLFSDQTTLKPEHLPATIESLHKAWQNDPEVIDKVARLQDANDLNLFGYIASAVAKLPPNSLLRQQIDTRLRLFPRGLQLFKHADAKRQLRDTVMSFDRKTLRFFMRFGSDLKELAKGKLFADLQKAFDTLPTTEKQKAYKMIQLIRKSVERSKNDECISQEE